MPSTDLDPPLPAVDLGDFLIPGRGLSALLIHGLTGTPYEMRYLGDHLAAAGIRGLYRIGDALSPRLISEAIFDGHRLAREIDAEDPSQPALYHRELADPGD